jgi:hypothetical protein
MIEGLTVPGVAKLPVTFSGTWPEPPKRDWRGVASAPEPIVAVTFLRWQHHVEWGLSSRLEDCEIETRLAIFPYDKAGLDVQVSVSIGGGGPRYRCTVPAATYQPAMPPASPVDTGTVALLTTIEGDPKIDFLALFIARSDTKGGRNRIWHLRPHFHDAVPPQLKEALTYGRTGTIED